MAVIREWMDEGALCLDMDPAIFHPEGFLPYILERKEREAKLICYDCPVRQECLDDALRWSSTNDPIGIRGGLTPAERRAYRRRHNIKPTKKAIRVRGVNSEDEDDDEYDD